MDQRINAMADVRNGNGWSVSCADLQRVWV